MSPRRFLRLCISASVAGVALVLVGASSASAHALGGRLDLPVPKWLFVYGAITALVVSFIALGILWTEPKLQVARLGRAVPGTRLWSSRVASMVFRALTFALFLLVVAGALGGNPNRNLAPVLTFIWLWVGLAFVHAFFGNLWACLSPFDTLARFFGIGREARAPYPTSWGRWPGALVIFAFVWLELVAPFAAQPRFLGWLIIAYSVWNLLGMWRYGREEWNAHGEGFAVYFGLLARMAPFGRDEDHALHFRAPLSGLPGLTSAPGTVAFIMVILGSTTFDGFTRSELWASWTTGLSEGAGMLAGTAGLFAAIGIVAGAYELAMVAAGSIAKTPWRPLSMRFAHTLVPIAFAYIVAHYFSYLVIDGQAGLFLISDPFGLSWNLFGTAYGTTNLTLVSTSFVWYVQVIAIVVGHIGGVMLAHDRAISMFDKQIALRTQYALLAVMVLFTGIGLYILSG